MMADLNNPSLLAAIERQNALYARCLDNDALEQWPEFFSERCEYQITTAANVRNGYPIAMVYADTRLMLVDRVRSLRQANIYEKQSYRHLLGRTLILGGTGFDDVETETPFMVARIMENGQTILYATGLYLDRVAVSEDMQSVVLHERKVICDSPFVDTLLAIPL